jgi:hypothetical protein
MSFLPRLRLRRAPATPARYRRPRDKALILINPALRCPLENVAPGQPHAGAALKTTCGIESAAGLDVQLGGIYVRLAKRELTHLRKLVEPGGVEPSTS